MPCSSAPRTSVANALFILEHPREQEVEWEEKQVSWEAVTCYARACPFVPPGRQAGHVTACVPSHTCPRRLLAPSLSPLRNAALSQLSLPAPPRPSGHLRPLGFLFTQGHLAKDRCSGDAVSCVGRERTLGCE